MRTGRFRPPSTSSELGRSRPSSHAISPDLEQVRDVRGCVLRCARHCARCAFVSVSLPERDCSWCVRPVLHPPAPPCTSLHPPASHCISLHPPRSPTRCPPCCLRCRCEPPTLSQTRPKADPDPKPATRTPTHQVPRLRSRRAADRVRARTPLVRREQRHGARAARRRRARRARGASCPGGERPSRAAGAAATPRGGAAAPRRPLRPGWRESRRAAAPRATAAGRARRNQRVAEAGARCESGRAAGDSRAARRAVADALAGGGRGRVRGSVRVLGPAHAARGELCAGGGARVAAPPAAGLRGRGIVLVMYYIVLFAAQGARVCARGTEARRVDR